MEILTPLIIALADSSASIGTVILGIILVSICLCVWQYYTKIRPEKDAAKEKREMRMLEIEERRSKDQADTNAYLRSSLETQRTILLQNTKAVQNLNKIMQSMQETFRMVSEKLAIQDRTSQQVNTMVTSMYHEMPSKENLSDMHNDLRIHIRDSVSREDAQEILSEINRLSEKMDGNYEHMFAELQALRKNE